MKKNKTLNIYVCAYILYPLLSCLDDILDILEFLVSDMLAKRSV